MNCVRRTPRKHTIMNKHLPFLLCLFLLGCGEKPPAPSTPAPTSPPDSGTNDPNPTPTDRPEATKRPLRPDELPTSLRVGTGKSPYAKGPAPTRPLLPVGLGADTTEDDLIVREKDDLALQDKLRGNAMDAIKSYMEAMESGDTKRIESMSTQEGMASYKLWASTKTGGENTQTGDWKSRGVQFMSDSENKIRVDRWNDASVSFQLTLQGGKWKVTGINVERQD